MLHKNIYIIYIMALLPLIGCSQSTNNKTTNTITNTEKRKTKHMMPDAKNIDTATLGAGCFWCVEAIYQQVNGVLSVKSGYSGGHVDNPTYEEVCDKTTGHAEVIQITYDTTVVNFTKILEVFFNTHDPTTLNQQGADKGPQYRSAVFYHNNEQKAIAEKIKTELNAVNAYPNPVVTEITAFTKFYDAEMYHQNYYNSNKNSNSYCAIVIRPKIEKFKKVFADMIKEH
jgi:peptide-methionine (S)-S-oxide reductase